jgi:uncharacterized membrane protein YukC
MRNNPVHRPSLIKEIEQLKSYKGLAAKAAKERLAELEAKLEDLRAKGRESEAFVEPNPSIKINVVSQHPKRVEAEQEVKVEEKPAKRKRK